jgi:hypothetical protein
MGFAMLVFACTACGSQAQANPKLVMCIPARWDGTQYVADADGPNQPICESCARLLKARFEHEGRPVPSVVSEAQYFERAYHEGADESDF